MKILLLIFLVCAIAVLHAQEKPVNYDKLKLEDAISMGLQQSKVVRLQKNATAILKEQENQSLNNKLPDVAIHSVYQRNTNLNQYEDGPGNSATTYNTIKDVYDFNIEASVPLYEGGKLNTQLQLAQQQTEVQQLRTTYSERQLKLEIITAYLDIYQLMIREKLVRDRMKEDSLNIRQVDAMEQNGLVTKNEVMRTRLQLSNHRLMLSTLSHNVTISEHRLQTVLGLSDLAQIHIDTLNLSNEFHSAIFPAEQYVQESEQNDELQIVRGNYELEQLNGKLVKSNVLPSLSLFGNYRLSNPNYKFFPPEDYFYRMGAVGLKLSIPVCSLYKNKTKEATANLRLNQRQIEIEQKSDQIHQAVFVACQKLEEADERILISLEAIEQARENYRVVKEKYAGNLAVITELTDADNACLEAESTLISNQIERLLKYYQLQFIIGKL